MCTVFFLFFLLEKNDQLYVINSTTKHGFVTPRYMLKMRNLEGQRRRVVISSK